MSEQSTSSELAGLSLQLAAVLSTSPANAPDLAAIKAWLGLEPDDTTDDVVLTESLMAALAAQAMVVGYPIDVDTLEPVMPADLREAIFLRTQRLAARRNSPEAVVGIVGTGGDFVGARLTSSDPDITRLEGPWLLIAIA